MADKPTILMYWGYHRKAWTSPFEALSDKFDFVYLFHYDQKKEIMQRPELVVRYFSEFKSIQDVLEEIVPEKIVFLGLDGLLSLMINFEAQKRRIETMIIQHGFLYKLEDQITEYYQERQFKDNRREENSDKQIPSSDRKYNNHFLIKSLRMRNLSFFFKILYTKIKYRQKSEHEQMLNLKTNKRLADRYLLYAPYFNDLYIKRDNVRSRIAYFGNPEGDEILSLAAGFDTNNETPYLLHIDQPILHAYQQGQQPKYSLKEGREFYFRLNQIAKTKRLRLSVKLHPFSFDFQHLYPQDDNITYIKNHSSLAQLIKESSLVTGFYSTLLLPAILLKRTFLFEITKDTAFVREMEQTYGVKVFSFYATPEDVSRQMDTLSHEVTGRIICDFFYKTNGQSLQRLEKLMMSNEKN